MSTIPRRASLGVAILVVALTGSFAAVACPAPYAGLLRILPCSSSRALRRTLEKRRRRHAGDLSEGEAERGGAGETCLCRNLGDRAVEG